MLPFERLTVRQAHRPELAEGGPGAKPLDFARGGPFDSAQDGERESNRELVEPSNGGVAPAKPVAIKLRRLL